MICRMMSNLMYVYIVVVFFFFKQKTAYEMRISDWSSDVCSSDLHDGSDAVTTPLPKRSAASTTGRQERLFGALEAVEMGQTEHPADVQIGRASCRERVCQYV